MQIDAVTCAVRGNGAIEVAEACDRRLPDGHDDVGVARVGLAGDLERLAPGLQTGARGGPALGEALDEGSVLDREA